MSNLRPSFPQAEYAELRNIPAPLKDPYMLHLPLLHPQWCPDRNTIPAGFAPADGQTIERVGFPDAWNQIQVWLTAGVGPVTADATWLSTPTERGKYTSGNGTDTFRLPDYNGKSAGSLGAVFLRGDGYLSAAISGVIQPSAMQDHHHPALNGSSTAVSLTAANALGGQVTAASGGDVAADPRYDDLAQDGKPFVGNASLLPGNRTADETRPLSATGCWIIKLFGMVTNPGALDAAALATVYATLVTRVAALEDKKTLGVDQIWYLYTVPGQRAGNTIYQNTTGRSIQVMVTISSQLQFQVSSDGSTWVSTGTGGSDRNSSLCPIVPNGWYYRVNGTAITTWSELR